MRLVGRERECALIDTVLADVRAGRSRALVLRGTAGSGKTALLRYAVETADGLRVKRITGIESEMQLAYAGIQQLVGRDCDETHLSALPAPQREALEVVLGLRAPTPVGRMLIGLAVLTLLSNVAATTPLLCVVDDAQWLDQESAEALAFVARRTQLDALGILVAVRETGPRDPSLPLHGLKDLQVEGLAPGAARELLATTAPDPVSEAVRDRLVAETGGNPLALLQITAALRPGQLSGQLPLPATLPLGADLEQALLCVVRTLPEATQTVLLVAAADPTGDEALVRRACAALDVPFEVIGAAEARGLVDLAEGIMFGHPLMRSAVLSGAPSLERRRAHQALADATDAAVDPDRRAWHRASATVGPDEDVAKELEASATRARERGGMSAAGTFLRKAGDLSADPRSRARRYLAAAMAAITAGSLDTAAELITLAERRPGLDRHQRKLVVLQRALVAGNRGQVGDAAPLFTTAARAFEPVNPSQAHWVHLLALWSYLHLGDNAPADAVAEAAAAASASPRSDPRSAAELLLDGFAARIIDSRGSAAPLFRQALARLDRDRSRESPPAVIEMATFAAIELWDDAAQDALSSRHLRSMRMLGALARLPHALSTRAHAEMLSGRLAEAQALYCEVHEVIQATGNPGAVGPVPPGEVMAAALRGDERRTRDLADAAVAHATPLRAGLHLNTIAHSLGLLALGHGRPAEAVEHLRFALTVQHSFVATTALPDLAEAAVRAGEIDLAQCAADQLLTSTRASDTSLALGIEARTQALLTDGAFADKLYRLAVHHLRQTRAVLHLARAQLLYGEWLRRQRRRRDARDQLRTAHEIFSAAGASAFAARARIELEATGERARRRNVDVAVDALTPQEARIARLAAEGASNPEIADQLYVSRRTVEAHLTKIYSKLGINSRTQLAYAMLHDLAG